MARGKKTGGKDFVKGDPRAGRPPLPADVRKASNLTKGEILAAISRFLTLDLDGLKAFLNKSDQPVIEHMIARIIVAAIKGGDSNRMNFLLDRLIGKVANEVKVSTPKPILIEYLNGDKVLLGQDKPDE